jgi:hypothetical protein
MTPEQLVALLEGIKRRVPDAAADAAMAMARTFEHYVKAVTLQRYRHPPGMWTLSLRGQPPAIVTGGLAGSVKSWPGMRTEFVAQAHAGAFAVYARVQEKGAVIGHKRAEWLHWENVDPRTGEWKGWYKKSVRVGPHPFFTPSVRDTIADGSLTRAAEDAFERAMWPAP